MLHARFQGNWSTGPRGEFFLRILPYMGVAAILVICLGPFIQTLVPLSKGDST